MEQVLIFFGCPLLIHRHTHTHTHTVFPILDGKQIHVKYCSQTVCKQFANSLQTVWKQCSQTVCKLFANSLQTVWKLFANCLQTLFPNNVSWCGQAFKIKNTVISNIFITQVASKTIVYVIRHK